MLWGVFLCREIASVSTALVYERAASPKEAREAAAGVCGSSALPSSRLAEWRMSCTRTRTEPRYLAAWCWELNAS